jgi:hypothetical protein
MRRRVADDYDVDRCGACGAALGPGASWCGQCFAAVGTGAHATRSVMSPPAAGRPAAVAGPAAATPGDERSVRAPVTLPGRGGLASPEPVVTLRRSRWYKSPTTFGPLGRVLCTVGLVVPLLVMIAGGLFDPFLIGGAGLWGVVIMPWGLRDVWKAGQVPVG